MEPQRLVRLAPLGDATGDGDSGFAGIPLEVNKAHVEIHRWSKPIEQVHIFRGR